MSSIEYINSVVLTASAANVTFSNIPQYYQDLILVAFATSDHTSDNQLRVRFNNSGGTNYSQTELRGNGSSATSSRITTGSTYGYLGYLGNSSTEYTTIEANILSYRNANIFKTCLISSGRAGAAVVSEVSLWQQTSAIDSILLISGAGNLRSGSTFTLWGVR